MSLPLIVSGCAASTVPAPSLAPRVSESIDPRIQPLAPPVVERAVDARVAARLATLIAQAINGNATFENAAARAEAAVATAGPAQSESWIAAQQALSQAVAGRSLTARALGVVDAMTADAIAAQGGIAPADFAAMRSAAARIAEIDQRQAARIDALQKRLGR
jgi:hypothetical protein